MENLVGQHIKGYELRETIGAGGFGAVYRAHQPLVGREVAIKIILPQYANHPDFIRRFEVEAQVIARLEHPHIIPLYDYWRDAEGAYLVMRFLRGGSLRATIKGNQMTLEAASKMLDHIAGALAVAHRQGVVHRDIKPDNILLDEEGNAYLTDFGIAKELGNEASNVTQADMVVGSPAYLSPEQVKSETVTPQSDIYSLGVVLYEVLTGQHPFPDAGVTALLIKHLQEPLPLVQDIREDVPAGVDEIIQRATAKDPAGRYPDAPSLAAAFRRVVLAGPSLGGDSTIHIGSVTREMMLDRTLLLEELDVDNPYKGLQAFEEADSANFFGRDALIDHLLNKIREQDDERFLAVIGPSGSGKSSVVQAGMIPRMRRGTVPGSERWFVVEMLPGAHPLEELEAALLRIAVNPPQSLLEQLKEDERGLVRATKRVLADNRSELFLFIDQFEEVFTLGKDKAEITHFLNSIVTAVTDPHCRLRVIVTLRADFYDQPLLYPAFGDLVRRYTEVVLPLTPGELELAIAGPAERVGVLPEPGLVQQITGDISTQPGALPLLQYALTELFNRRSGRVMTLAAYHKLGGALGALARRADEIYGELDSKSQEVARQLFLRLVNLGEGGTDNTRRRAMHTELNSIGNDPAAMEKVIEYFGKSRLLTFDHDPQTREPTIEVAHEALIREWKQLREWLEDGREDLLMQRRLEAASVEWLKSRKDRSYLASGTRLTQFEEWQARSNLALSAEESEYLRNSIAEREAMLAQEAERQAREQALEQRSRNRLRLLVAVMTVAAVIAVGLAGFAFNQGQIAQQERVKAEDNANAAAIAQSVAEANRIEAEENAANAERSANEARSLALAANSRNLLSEHNPNLALALAIEASNIFHPPAADIQQTLAQTAYGPAARFRLEGHSGSVLSVASSDQLGLSVSADGTMHLWNLIDGSEVSVTFNLDGGVANSVAISHDSKTGVTGMFDGSVILWNLETGDPIRRFEGHTDIVNSVSFSPDESQILSASMDRTIRLWNVDDGEEVRSIESPGAILKAAFSPDGKYVVTGSADKTAASGLPVEDQDRTVRVWFLETGREIRKFEPKSGFVRAVAFSPDGSHVLSGTWNSVDGGTLQYWDIETGELERRFYGHTDIISEVKFSADGQKILSGSWDRSLRLWDVGTGVELERFDGHHDRILSASFGLNDGYVLVGTGNIGNNIPNPQADAVVDSSVWLWDLRSRAQIRALMGHQDWVWSAVISPDGRYAATGSGPFNLPTNRTADTTMRLWDLQTGEQVRIFEGHTNTVNMVAFSPDGQTIASASWDGTVRLWDVATGEGRVGFEGHTNRVLSVNFSPDGQSALSTGCGEFDSNNRCINGEIILWDVATGEEIRRFEGHTAAVNNAVFSPDGGLIASSADDNSVRVWDAETSAEVKTLSGHTNRVTNVVFSPDGKLLLSTAWDTTARLWEVETGRELRQLVGHSRAVFGAAFSPDGKMALTGSADLTIRLWDVATGSEIREFDGHTNWVLSVVFSPDGHFILSGAEDNTARTWHMARTLDELIAWARDNRYVPELSCAEREQYRVEPLCETAS
jgi:WD40 repeat protein/serine/threonine protein kinase